MAKRQKAKGIAVAIDLPKLTEICEQTWGRQVEPKAAAYFARLMKRQIKGFTSYLPSRGTITLRHVHDAASRYYE